VIGEAQPPQTAARLALLASRGKPVAVGAGQRQIEGLRKPAAIDCKTEQVGHRHRLGRDHVEPPELCAIEAALAGRGVDKPLEDIDRLTEARSARDAGRRGVGEHGRDLEADGGKGVNGALEMNILVGLQAAGHIGHVGADIGDACHAQRQEFAGRVERQGGAGLLVTGVMLGEKAFAAGRDPLHRPTDAPGGPQDQHMLGVNEVLGAKAAADVGRDEPHLRRRRSERLGGVVAIAMDVLAGDMQRVAPARRVVEPDAAARLHRIGDDAVIVEVELDHMCRRLEGGVDGRMIAGPPLEADIARHIRCKLWRAWSTSGGSGRHRRQRHIVDRDQLGGIERQGLRLGGDERHRLADEAHLAAGQQRLQVEGEFFARLDIGFGIGPQGPQPIGVRIRGGQHRQHAGCGAGGCGVDRADQRMGVRRTQHDCVDEAVEAQIVEIGALTGDETRILAPSRRVADHRSGCFVRLSPASIGFVACRHAPSPLSKPQPSGAASLAPDTVTLHGFWQALEVPAGIGPRVG